MANILFLLFLSLLHYLLGLVFLFSPLTLGCFYCCAVLVDSNNAGDVPNSRINKIYFISY
jgi:hypothetical protein